MKHVARTETTPQGVSPVPTPRLTSRFEALLKGGLLLVAMALLAGFVPCGAATPMASLPEENAYLDVPETPDTGAAAQRRETNSDGAPLLVLTLAGFALLAISRVPSNPKKGQRQSDFRAGKNDARGQDLPVTGGRLATR